MKKFMAIVMCLAMALSMMTVVSFAADITVGGSTVTAAPGEVVDIPVYVNANIFLGMTQLTIAVPEEVAFEAVKGAIPGMTVDGNTIILFDDAGIDFTTDLAAVTIKATAPATEGEYAIEFVDGENFLIDSNYDEIPGVAFNAITLKVEAEEVEPSIGAVDTTVPSANEDGVLKVLELIGNPTEFGIKYIGEDADYKGTEFPGKIEAETSTTYAAVEVIGLDDAFEAYAR